jgi:hypothetical protein
VIVGKTSIRIKVAKEPIIRGALGASGSKEPPVPSFARKWRTRQDETANTYIIEIIEIIQSYSKIRRQSAT